MGTEQDKRGQEILERVERERGFARVWPKLLAERDPRYLECLHNVATHVLLERNALPRKTKEIILSCLNAFSFYEFGFRIHVRSALQAGATEEELLEALEVVGIGNLHGMTSMLPILVEEIGKFREAAG
jgi:alkylhydroperoxidase/carboxymuconolactone decarboxylase family protein YurZ